MIEEIRKIESKEDFIDFLRLLSKDAEKNLREWENQTIPDYLEQIASWVEDYSDSPANKLEWEKIDYKPLALMLYMGKIYE